MAAHRRVVKVYGEGVLVLVPYSVSCGLVLVHLGPISAPLCASSVLVPVLVLAPVPEPGRARFRFAIPVASASTTGPGTPETGARASSTTTSRAGGQSLRLSHGSAGLGAACVQRQAPGEDITRGTVRYRIFVILLASPACTRLLLHVSLPSRPPSVSSLTAVSTVIANPTGLA